MAADPSPGDQQELAYEARFTPRPKQQWTMVLATVPLTAGTFSAGNAIGGTVVISALALVAADGLREHDYQRGRTALRADSRGLTLGRPWPASKARIRRIPWPQVVAVHIRHRKGLQREQTYLEVEQRTPARLPGVGGAAVPAVIVERASLRARLSGWWHARLRRDDQLRLHRWHLDRDRLQEIMHLYAPHARLLEEPPQPASGGDSDSGSGSGSGSGA